MDRIDWRKNRLTIGLRESLAAGQLKAKPGRASLVAVQLQLRLDSRLYDRLRLLAAVKQIPMTGLITRMLETGLKPDQRPERVLKARSTEGLH